MIGNRELTIDDYVAILRRRRKVILIPVLLAPLAAFLVSYAFPPKYTSQALVLVEGQKVPEGYVKPVVTEDLTQRIATIQQQILSQNRLQPMIERLGLAKGKNLDDTIDELRLNVSIQGVDPEITASRRHRPGQNDVPGFYVNFTADNPRIAQQVCTELTSMLLEENLETREQAAQSTTDFLARSLEQAKKDLDSQDAKLAAFQKQYLGQLPGDEDNNLKLLMGLNSQLDANTQTLNRAQQDKSFAESLLAQQSAAWKTAQTAANPESLQKQLDDLQSQLIILQGKYTDDHPDVVKTKHDIAEIKQKLAEADSASTQGAAPDRSKSSEPPEIRQLRLQIHQYDETIAQATRDQKRLEDSIKTYQGRLALSPAVEEQYKQLTRNYATAQKFYDDLLGKKSQSEMQTDMERRQQGEQMTLLDPANLPDSPSFPNRLEFAGGGLGAGVALGFGLALWLELRDKAIRTEQDVLAALELPTLVSVPWLGANGAGKTTGKSNDRTQASPGEPKKEIVEAQVNV
jgi:polysaccharide chain length determinant protein (PEP-CTERM system associated)